MFQKKQYIYSETQGLCRVENIVQLRRGKGREIPYYVLKPVYEDAQVSYIPVHNHQVQLRELFSEEEAAQLAESEEIKKDQKLQAAVNFVLQQEEEKKNAGKRKHNQ